MMGQPAESPSVGIRHRFGLFSSLGPVDAVRTARSNRTYNGNSVPLVALWSLRMTALGAEGMLKTGSTIQAESCNANVRRDRESRR